MALAALGALAMPWLRMRSLFASSGPIPTRPLGNTGVRVTILGLGGEGVLRTWGREREAAAVIQRALDAGITYCDTAPAYSGSQDYYGAVLRERRREIFLASKTHDRTRDGSLRLLEESLRRLKTDHLDLWQLHDLREMEELDDIFGPRGVLRAMEEAKAEGRVRFLGLTGHYDPEVLLEAIRRYPFDTLLVALNAADRARRSFIERLLPAATERGMGIVGMKVLAAGRLLRHGGIQSAGEALRYVLSLPVSTAILGFRTISEIDEAVAAAREFRPLSEEDIARLEQLARPFADEATAYKRLAG